MRSVNLPATGAMVKEKARYLASSSSLLSSFSSYTALDTTKKRNVEDESEASSEEEGQEENEESNEDKTHDREEED